MHEAHVEHDFSQVHEGGDWLIRRDCTCRPELERALRVRRRQLLLHNVTLVVNVIE